MKLLLTVAMAAVGLTGQASGPEAAGDTNKFGFTGPEIFPLDNQIAQLRAVDLDGDGLKDLVVINNARSRINLLYNQTGKTNRAEGGLSRLTQNINDLPPDARFRLDSISSEKRISSLVVTDLNHDGRPDLAYYGEPKELAVQYNQTNGWSALKRWPLEDGLLDPYALIFGDLNGDKRQDLLLLAESHIYLLKQNKEGELDEPQKIPYVGSVKSIQVLDIQGDGREDLLLVNWDSLHPFRFRLQNERGDLGPEMHFSLPPIRSYWADDLDGDGRTEMVTISQKSGRAQISNFTPGTSSPLLGDWKQGQFQILPLQKTTKAKRGSSWSDLNRDGAVDLLVSEPDSGQLTLFLQGEQGAMQSPKTFATLIGVSEMVVMNWDEDPEKEIFLLSVDERQIGATQCDDKGRIGFPKMLPVEGRPLAIAGGILRPNGKPVLATVVDMDGKREFRLYQAEGGPYAQKLSENFKSNPSGLALHDVNQDGLLDVVILIPYEKIKILLQKENAQEFVEVDAAAPGGSAEQPWHTMADVDGDGKVELLLAQKNFLRAVVLERDESISSEKQSWTFKVKEQINGAGSNSRIVGAGACPQPGKEVPALFLLDAERKCLTLSEKDNAGIWQVARNIPLPVTDFNSVQPIELGAKTGGAVSLLGVNSIAWLPLSGDVWQFTELDGYETPIRDGYLHDVVSGDLNNDGRKDLVFLETQKSYLDIVTFEKPHELVPANRWQVFEERTFRNRRNDMAEPREALVADLTGDALNDLAVVVHDRILVYPQE